MSELESKWGGPLQPYSAFLAHYSRGYEWAPRVEFVVQRSLRERFRVTVERGHPPAEDWLGAYDMAREDALAEQGIYAGEEDAKELGKALFDTLFQYCNELEMQAVIDQLAAYIAGQDKARAADKS